MRARTRDRRVYLRSHPVLFALLAAARRRPVLRLGRTLLVSAPEPVTTALTRIPLDREAPGTTGAVARALSDADLLFDQQGPAHRTARRDLAALLGSAGVARLRPVWLAVLDRHVARLRTGARLDVTDLAAELSGATAAALLGITADPRALAAAARHAAATAAATHLPGPHLPPRPGRDPATAAAHLTTLLATAPRFPAASRPAPTDDAPPAARPPDRENPSGAALTNGAAPATSPAGHGACPATATSAAPTNGAAPATPPASRDACPATATSAAPTNGAALEARPGDRATSPLAPAGAAPINGAAQETSLTGRGACPVTSTGAAPISGAALEARPAGLAAGPAPATSAALTNGATPEAALPGLATSPATPTGAALANGAALEALPVSPIGAALANGAALEALPVSPAGAALTDDAGLEARGPEMRAGLAAMLAVAAINTTVAAIPRAVAWCADDGLWPAAEEGGAVLDALVGELLRVTAPTPLLPRAAGGDGELGGCPVRRGDRMILVTRHAAGAHERAPDPHDPAPAQVAQLVFGAGAHACPGAALARAQLRDVLAALAPFRPRVVAARVDRRAALPGWRRLEVEA